MIQLSDQQLEQIRAEARAEGARETIRHLVHYARDPERIGKRVLVMDYATQEKTKREKLREFASGRIKLSIPRASSAVADAEAILFAIRRGDSGRTDAGGV